jgi:hypothetical protein
LAPPTGRHSFMLSDLRLEDLTIGTFKGLLTS